MTLKIKKNSDNEIIVSLNPKVELVISEKREDFKHEKINSFLVSLASSIPNDKKLEVAIEENENTKNDNVFEHVVFLFTEFTKNLNNE